MREVTRVFHKAMQFFPRHSLVIEYLEFNLNKYEDGVIGEEEMREIFENCISICGFDVYEAQNLWQMYRNFEIAEHREILQDDNEDSEELNTAKLRVIGVFRRQLSLPMLGNEGVLLDFQMWLSSHCTESDTDIIDPLSLNDKYEKAVADYAARTPFEERLSTETFQTSSISEKLNVWKAYIQFEIDDNQISRADRLYRRASSEIGNFPGFWEAYVSFAVGILKDPAVRHRSYRNITIVLYSIIQSLKLSLFFYFLHSP